ncbi:outer membrane biogenesis lipoprotein LolB [Paenibacillus sp. RC254]|uniref:hypothetical protein n=1 Tax=unclassified Paenibacillus TaxID=185978 RepID=UPI0024BA5130|nr:MULTISPECIES: hypothetical protein [unclassified Paenibacillus]
MTKCRTISLLLVLALSMTLLAACTDNSAEELPNIASSQSHSLFQQKASLLRDRLTVDTVKLS